MDAANIFERPIRLVASWIEGEEADVEARPVVFLVDDEETVLVALSRMLQRAGYEVRAWTSPLEFLRDHDSSAAGCLVCDLVMPAMSGLELQQKLSSAPLPRPIIFITGQGDVRTTVQAMKAGAVTFLSKPVTRVELVAAVEEAARRDAAARAVEHARSSVSRRLQTLTRREREVMDLVTTGLRNKQIAAKLGIAEKTIKAHRGRMMRKMRVSSVAALVKLLASR